MKLVFEKKDSQTINLKIDRDGDIQDFDYIAMLKGLIDCGSLDESELKGDFSEVERNSISSMVKLLNECLPRKEGQINLDDDFDKVNIETGIDDEL